MNVHTTGGLYACRPILCVESVRHSIAYYVGSLDFKLGWAWSEKEQRFLEPGDDTAPGFALVGNGPVQLMLCQKAQGAPGMWLHFDVDTAEQLDRIHDKWKRQGARIIEAPLLRPWGMYEMRVQDLDQHVLRVSSPGHKPTPSSNE